MRAHHPAHHPFASLSFPNMPGSVVAQGRITDAHHSVCRSASPCVHYTGCDAVMRIPLEEEKNSQPLTG